MVGVFFGWPSVILVTQIFQCLICLIITILFVDRAIVNGGADRLGHTLCGFHAILTFLSALAALFRSSSTSLSLSIVISLSLSILSLRLSRSLSLVLFLSLHEPMARVDFILHRKIMNTITM